MNTAPALNQPLAPPVGVSRVLWFSSIAALGGFLFGFDTAVINGGVVAIRNQFQIGAVASGLSVSLALLGSAAGAFAAGPMADRVGRSRAMIIAAVCFFISAIGSGLPFTIYDFTIWRILGGIGVGMASVIAPAYIAEVAPAHLRGRLGSMQQLAIVVGIFAAAISNYIIASVAGSAEARLWLGLYAWQWMFLVGAIPALLYGLGATLIPESPRYLVAVHRDVEAKAILSRILGGDTDRKVSEIRESLRQDRPPRLGDIASKRTGLLPIVWVGIALAALQQLVGINVIFYYSNLLWQTVGFTEQSAMVVTTIMSLTNIITTLVGIALIDRIGRRLLLIVGSIGMFITLGTLAVIFGTAPLNEAGQPSLGGSSGIIALIAANLYVFCFGFSWGPVVWVLLGEMFANRIRASALSVGAAANWVANFVVSTTFPPLVTGLGLGAAYGMYAGFAAASLVFVLLAVRETRGMELEDARSE